MFADLPPSSRNTRFSVSAPRAMMRLPTAVEPVNEIMSTRGSPVSTSPTAAGSPDVTTLNTPGGMSVSSATILPIARRRVTACRARASGPPCYPAASAGASFERLSMNGKFHGVIAPTTPIGSRTTQPVRLSCRRTRGRRARTPTRSGRCRSMSHCMSSMQRVLLDRVREPDRRADLGDDLRPQLLACACRARPSAAARHALAERRGRSTSRSRRTPAAPRRSRGPCRRRRRRRPGR